MSASMTSGTSWRSVDASGTQSCSAPRASGAGESRDCHPSDRGGRRLHDVSRRSFGVVIHARSTCAVCSSRSPTKSRAMAPSLIADRVAARLHGRLALGRPCTATGSTPRQRQAQLRRHPELPHLHCARRSGLWRNGDRPACCSTSRPMCGCRVAPFGLELRADVGGHTVAENVCA